MRKWLLLFFIITSFDASSAIRLSGKMTNIQNWKNVLYVSELKDYTCVFSGGSHCISDSIILDVNGRFVYDKLKPNTAYRITSSPDKFEQNAAPTGLFIQDGQHDNYLFFVTGLIGESLYLEGQLSQLFISHTLSTSDSETAKLNAFLDSFRSVKRPILSLMGSFKSSLETGSSEIEKMEAFQKVNLLNEKSNIQIDSLLTSVSDYRIYVMGLVFRGVDFFDEKLSRYYFNIIQKKFDLTDNKELLHSITVKLKRNIESGQISPLFLIEQYKTLDGELFSFVNPIQSSKILVIDFWASWCLPCRKSIRGELRSLSMKYTKDQLIVIGVNLDNDKRLANEAIKKDENDFLQLYDYPEGKFRETFDLSTLPFYIVVNQENQAVFSFRKVSEMLEYIDGILK